MLQPQPSWKHADWYVDDRDMLDMYYKTRLMNSLKFTSWSPTGVDGLSQHMNLSHQWKTGASIQFYLNIWLNYPPPPAKATIPSPNLAEPGCGTHLDESHRSPLTSLILSNSLNITFLHFRHRWMVCLDGQGWLDGWCSWPFSLAPIT